MANGLPYSKWYWSDWRSDPGLRMCSYGARGLWADMLSVMGDAEPCGYLIHAGRPMEPADLAALFGGPVELVLQLISELEQRGVFSRDRAGTIYSRRIVRDVERVKKLRKNGKKGGNPTLRKTTTNSGLDNQADNQGVNPYARSQMLDAREELDNTTTESPNPGARSAAVVAALEGQKMDSSEGVKIDPRYGEVAGRLQKLIGSPSPLNMTRLHAWLRSGADPDVDIVPTVERLMAGRSGTPPRSLAYFDQAVAEALASRTRQLPEVTHDPASSPASPHGPAGSRLGPASVLEIGARVAARFRD